MSQRYVRTYCYNNNQYNLVRSSLKYEQARDTATNLIATVIIISQTIRKDVSALSNNFKYNQLNLTFRNTVYTLRSQDGY